MGSETLEVRRGKGKQQLVLRSCRARGARGTGLQASVISRLECSMSLGCPSPQGGVRLKKECSVRVYADLRTDTPTGAATFDRQFYESGPVRTSRGRPAGGPCMSSPGCSVWS